MPAKRSTKQSRPPNRGKDKGKQRACSPIDLTQDDDTDPSTFTPAPATQLDSFSLQQGRYPPPTRAPVSVFPATTSNQIDLTQDDDTNPPTLSQAPAAQLNSFSLQQGRYPPPTRAPVPTFPPSTSSQFEPYVQSYIVRTGAPLPQVRWVNSRTVFHPEGVPAFKLKRIGDPRIVWTLASAEDDPRLVLAVSPSVIPPPNVRQAVPHGREITLPRCDPSTRAEYLRHFLPPEAWVGDGTGLRLTLQGMAAITYLVCVRLEPVPVRRRHDHGNVIVPRDHIDRTHTSNLYVRFHYLSSLAYLLISLCAYR